VLSPRFLLLLGSLTCLGFADPVVPAITKTVLFAAGDLDYASYRIPAIIVTPQQTVLVAAEGRKNNRNDWGLIDIFYRRSLDSGVTWEAARPLVRQQDLPADMAVNPVTTTEKARPPGFTISNATWITDAKQGRTFFLFCVEYMRCFIIESTDGGATFSKPREITDAFAGYRQNSGYAWRVIATGPGHGVQLASGRLVVPVWLSTADGSNAHRPSVSGTITSDDGGATWQSGEIAAGRGDDVVNPSETVVVEVAPGKVMLNIRNESPRHRRASVWSANGATGWSRPEFNETLLEPVCMASIVRQADGSLVFSNPATLEPNPARPTAIALQRQNLGLRLSRDAGQTWSEPLVLEPGLSAYSDLAVAPDGTILCFYEHGAKNPYESMSLARVSPGALSASRP
jgi:sialidase-1